MVGGPLVNGQEDFSQYPFNLATEGYRQPGSAFKPFTLAVALEHGYGPSSVFDSRPLDLIVPHSGGKEHFYGPQLRQRLRRARPRSPPPPPTPTTACSRSSGLSPGVGTTRIARDGHGDGHPLPGLHQLRDDHRRPQGRRDHRWTWPTPMRRSPTAGCGCTTRCSAPLTRARSASPRSSVRTSAASGKRNALFAVPRYRRVIPAGVAADDPSDFPGRGPAGHRHPGGDRRRRRRRQDRDHEQLRGRLVRRLDAADHDGGVGRLIPTSWSR